MTRTDHKKKSREGVNAFLETNGGEFWEERL